MFVSARAFFKDGTANNTRILIRAETQLPQEFARRYRKNVVPLTPKKTGALRRSIITEVRNNQAQISWRSRYAKVQNQGFHTVNTKRVVNINGRFVTLMPGQYRHAKYTTGGTGPRFATIAYQKTMAEMPAVIRELGLTK